MISTATATAPAHRPLLVLNSGQRRFIESEKPMVCYCGGIGSGKTWIGCRTAYSLARQYPKAVGLITANSYDQLQTATLPPFFAFLRDIGEEYVLNKRPPWGGSKFQEHHRILSLRSGAQIICGSLEEYDLYRGIEIGWWWGDETRDTKREAFDVISGRLRDPNGPHFIRLTTTPKGYDWLYEMFEESPLRDPSLRFHRELIRTSTRHNAHNLRAGYIEEQMSLLTPEMARQELGGEFLNVFTGQVYSCFNRALHVSSKVAYEPREVLALSCDFNVSPMAWIVAQRQIAAGDVIIDEVWRDRPREGTSAVESAARDFIARYAQHQGTVKVYGDAAGHQRNSATTRTDYLTLMDVLRGHFGERVQLCARLNTEGNPAANPPIADRVSVVNARMKNALGQHQLTISERCRYLIRDLEQVAWKDTTTGRVFDKTSNKDLTHISDALGYWLFTLYGRGNTVGLAGNSAEVPLKGII